MLAENLLSNVIMRTCSPRQKICITEHCLNSKSIHYNLPFPSIKYETYSFYRPDGDTSIHDCHGVDRSLVFAQRKGCRSIYKGLRKDSWLGNWIIDLRYLLK